MERDMKYAWLWLILGLLAGILSGCDSEPPTTEPISSCAWAGIEQVACDTTLDDCIAQGHEPGQSGGDCWISGSAEPDELDLFSDGITNSYTRKFAHGGILTGTWQRVDSTVVMSDGNVVALIESN